MPNGSNERSEGISRPKYNVGQAVEKWTGEYATMASQVMAGCLTEFVSAAKSVVWKSATEPSKQFGRFFRCIHNLRLFICFLESAGSFGILWLSYIRMSGVVPISLL